ncbi:hypothetical protein [Imperialibacter sp.]|uniref:hypothetical protein n=1 Tax=Imperialibacter sp. TaxID=2038411 RepID=UPI0032EC9AD1
MGYMGFGMRRENYTRKPKKAFKKLKQVYGDDVDLPKSNINTQTEKPISFERHSYMPFDRSRFYLLFKVILLGTVAATVVWTVFLQHHYIDYRRGKFEQNEFPAYYKHELAEFDAIFSFLKSRTNRMISANYREWRNDYTLRLKHFELSRSKGMQKINYSNFEGLTPTRERRQNNDEIFSGTLTIEREGYLSKTYQNQWVYTLNDVTIEQVPNSVVEYLESDKGEFTEFLEKLKLVKEYVYIEDDSVCTYFSHDTYGSYRLVYTTHELKSTSIMQGSFELRTIVGKLDKNIYWLRSEKQLRSQK